MPLGISDARENTIIDHIFRNQAFTPPTAVYLSLHTAYPGDTGASEVTGGSYARQEMALDAASAGATANTATEDFPNMPAVGGDGVWGVGIWDAASAGNFMAGGVLQPSGGHRKVFVVEDADLANNDITSPGHGLTANDRVVFVPLRAAGSLPTGIVEGTLYHVISTGLTADVFRVSTTQGGSALDITAIGMGVLYKVVNKVVNADDTFRIAAGELDFLID
jgi:hypothetical protein